MRKIFILLSVLICTSVNAQFQNIMIGGKISESYPNEPSIVVNPNNTNEVVAGANISNCYISKDGGFTWNHNILNSSYGVWGDPCLITDDEGRFYFFHLSNPPGEAWVDRIVCQRLDNINGTWNNGSFTGYNGTKLQDKEWAVFDNKTKNLYVCWTQFDKYFDSTPENKSNIHFSKSTDRGLTWSDAKRINKVSGDCLDGDNTVEGAVPAVGPNGEIYVSWAGPEGIVFDKSLDEGETWMDEDVFVSDFPGGWDFPVEGIADDRVNGMPVTKCDLSGGEFNGTIYINWSDQRNGATDTDVWLTKSVDGGMTWSPKVRVNDDPPGRHQFFCWMDIDQTTGYIYIVFYDRRNYEDTRTDVYMAVSRDGGESFQNIKISESPFVPNPQRFAGDYNNISVYNGVIRPVWIRLDFEENTMWTAIINEADIVSVKEINENILDYDFKLLSVYPNPFNPTTNIKYELKKSGNLVIKVYDSIGLEVETIKNKYMEAGEYSELWDASSYSSGVYFIHSLFENRVTTAKVVLQK